MTLLDAMNYAGTILAAIGGMVAIVYTAQRVETQLRRNASRRRHPASIGRRERIITQRRAAIDRRNGGQ